MIININDLINVEDRSKFGIESESLYKKLDVTNDSRIKCLSREIIISKVHIIETSANSEPDKSYIGAKINVITTFINDVREQEFLLRCKEPTIFCLAEEFVNSSSIDDIIIY